MMDGLGRCTVGGDTAEVHSAACLVKIDNAVLTVLLRVVLSGRRKGESEESRSLM